MGLLMQRQPAKRINHTRTASFLVKLYNIRCKIIEGFGVEEKPILRPFYTFSKPNVIIQLRVGIKGGKIEIERSPFRIEP
jgi:hypothetical protein